MAGSADVVAALDPIVFFLTGRHIPTGNPQGCRAAAQALHQAGVDVGAMAQRLGTMVGEVHTIGEGKGHEAFMEAASHLAVYSGELSLVLGGLGDGVNGLADSIDDTWTEIWEDLAGIAVTIAFGFVTAGIADLVEGPLLIATGGRIAWALSRFSTAVKALAARIGTVPTYYLLDAAAWSAMDQGATNAVRALQGQPRNGMGDAARSAAANVAFDATFDATQAGTKTVLRSLLPGPLGMVAAALLKPNARAVSLLGRVGLRMTSSTAYTAADNVLAGRVEEPADALPTDPQWHQKEASHVVGRTAVDIILGKGKGAP
jgi:hypothetical protein